jgi:hypothetical protein
MLSRRRLLGLAALSSLAVSCEALGLQATIVTSTTINGETKTTVREAKNWEEFQQAMGEVATDFSDFAKEVGATTAELISTLVDVPPAGQVKLGHLAESLQPYEGDIRYDYLKVASMNPNAKYDFKYVQIGMPEYDNFFRASAEMYASAYQLMETGRHMFLASHNVKGEDPPKDVERGTRQIRRDEVDSLVGELSATQGSEKLIDLWTTTSELGARLAEKAVQVAQTGTSLVASAPTQILNPKLVLHLDLIVKGLEQSVSMVKDTGGLLTKIVG